MTGRSKSNASICQPTETSSGSRVRRLGTTATSSKEYARRPRLPRPISISLTRVRLPVTRGGAIRPYAGGVGELNWAANVDYGTDRVLRPTSIGELQDAVRHSRKLR